MKSLIIAQWIILIAAIASGFVEEKYLPDMLIFYLAEQEAAGFTSAENITFSVISLFFVGYLISSIGLLCMKRWSRSLYLNVNIGLIIVTFFVGPQIVTPVSFALNDIYMAMVGLTIGLLYFTDTKELFEARNS